MHCRPHVNGDTYDGPEVFTDEVAGRNYDGVVIRIEEGRVIYPKDFPFTFDLQEGEYDLEHLPVMAPATVTDGTGSARPVLLSAKQIDGNFYYIDWWEMADYQAAINYEKTIGEAISALEKLYDAKLLLLWKPDEDTSIDEIRFLYVSEALGTPESLEDLGIIKEDLISENANLTINKSLYAATYEELLIFDRPAKAVVLLNPVSNNTYILNCIVIAAGFILVSITVMILWLYWIRQYIANMN